MIHFPVLEKVISEVRGPDRGERVIVSATESEKVGATRRLRLEQQLSSLLLELVFRFRQQVDLVLDLFAEKFSTAVTCFKAPRPRMLARCVADLECFHVAKEP